MVEKRTVVATVAQSASLLVMTLPPNFFISGEYSSAVVAWQTKLDDFGSALCHKNDMPRPGISSKMREILQRTDQRLVICRPPPMPVASETRAAPPRLFIMASRRSRSFSKVAISGPPYERPRRSLMRVGLTEAPVYSA